MTEKKTYIAPEVEILTLATENSILYGSNEGGDENERYSTPYPYPNRNIF